MQLYLNEYLLQLPLMWFTGGTNSHFWSKHFHCLFFSVVFMKIIFFLFKTKKAIIYFSNGTIVYTKFHFFRLCWFRVLPDVWLPSWWPQGSRAIHSKQPKVHPGIATNCQNIHACTNALIHHHTRLQTEQGHTKGFCVLVLVDCFYCVCEPGPAATRLIHSLGLLPMTVVKAKISMTADCSKDQQ